MPRIELTIALVVCTLSPAVSFACGDAQGTQTGVTGWYTELTPSDVTVEQVSSWQAAGRVVLLDVNTPEVRNGQGQIPGATLLSSSSRYGLAELPVDRSTQLVFYCSNEQCTASRGAAQRALELGFSRVAVLRGGIKAWKAAGKPTAKPRT